MSIAASMVGSLERVTPEGLSRLFKGYIGTRCAETTMGFTSSGTITKAAVKDGEFQFTIAYDGGRTGQFSGPLDGSAITRTRTGALDIQIYGVGALAIDPPKEPERVPQPSLQVHALPKR